MSESRPPMGPSLPGQRPSMAPQGPSLPKLAPAGAPVKLAPPSGPAKIAPPVAPPPKPDDPALEPLSLVDDSAGDGMSKIKALRQATITSGYGSFKRNTNVNGRGATRVKTFHGRLSEEGMAFLDAKINEWVDQNPEVEIKFVTNTIGVFEGKIRENALVLNLWY